MLPTKEKIAAIKQNWESSTWEEVAQFIGPNADGYRGVWERRRDMLTGRAKKGGLSWCWPALIPLLGIPWAAARKNWIYVWIMIMTIVAINIIVIFFPSGNYGFMVFLAPFMAKPSYVDRAVEQIARIKNEIQPGPDRIAAIQARGGINMKNGYIAGGICAALTVLVVIAETMS